MASHALVEKLLALPLAERIDLALALLASIDEVRRPEDDDGRKAVEQAAQRDAELSSGTVVGRDHEKVMTAARRSLG